ncbi:MAG TPA: hypothetical protein VHW23_25285 [Kofleriaceae bacterium]|jgi:hypothetical protein|nr:hypothetical protein [Kofleriaceae bacterium]
MRQPVSRISFDRRRGFLGAYLQEGALFVDAVWNEAADIARSQLRDAIVAAGIAGTAGRELRIDPVICDQRLVNLVVRGTGAPPPRPFYCDGLPVLWPADLPIDAQPIGDRFRAETTGHVAVPAGRTWIDLLQELSYEIYLRARVETLDRLDDPDLDDPGLDATRGSFRKRVVGEIRIARAGEHRAPVATSIQLSVDGSYRSDLNALYRVELDALTGTRSAPAASVLWDPDAAATVARVLDTDTAPAGTRQILLDTTDGFDGGFVRFEGPGTGPELYRVTKAPGAETTAIQVTRHRCDRAELSLSAWQTSGAVDRQPPPGQFAITFVTPAPAPVQAGDILTELPDALYAPWPEAKVVAVTAFDASRNAVTLVLARPAPDELSPRALSVADWAADGPATGNTDGTFTAVLIAPPAIETGDIVVSLPPGVGTPDTGPWVVLRVEPVVPPPLAAAPAPRPAAPTPVTASSAGRTRSPSNAAALAAVAATTAPAPVTTAPAPVTTAPAPVTTAPPPAPARRLVRVTFGPAGLARPLSRLDTARKATLHQPAHASDTTIVVGQRDDWQPGVRICIAPAAGHAASPTATAPREERTIVRIVRIEPLTGNGPALMAVRLDQPLSYDHASGDDAVPERVIRARRYAGHKCRLAIDRVDPARDGAAAIASFSSGLALPHGLSIHLTIEKAAGTPQLTRGDGWNFAARSDGFVETRLFAAVDDEPASEVPLALLTLSAHGHELIDLRPVPAGLAADEPLARIREAASALAGALGEDPALPVIKHAAALAGYPRVQPCLVRRLGELAHTHHSKLHGSAACRYWLERLREAVGAVAGHEPTRRQLTAISCALDGLTFAFTSAQPPHRAAPSTQPPPRKP